MHILTYLIDTFTSASFKGNPTAVCLITQDIASNKLLSIANELNQPVTAFIRKLSEGDLKYSIRYFTSTTEIPACGHATLASARVVLSTEGETRMPRFLTVDDVQIDTGLSNDRIFLSYPRYELQAYDLSKSTMESLGIQAIKTAGFCSELETLFIEMEDPLKLRNVQPNYPMLVESNDQIKEVVITSASDISEYDFLLRSFCPWIGIDEDPVTGSVHSVLADFWKERTGKDKLKAFQASKRGGEVFVEIEDNKVKLGGDTVVVMKGELYLD